MSVGVVGVGVMAVGSVAAVTVVVGVGTHHGTR
jgi:hypothetical protein